MQKDRFKKFKERVIKNARARSDLITVAALEKHKGKFIREHGLDKYNSLLKWVEETERKHRASLVASAS